jgi:ADP-ribosyl-[dinitrogen reductase] hydrolase
MIRADFYHDGGPRGSGQKAPVDTEIEEFLRTELAVLTPDWSIEGEELAFSKGSDPSHCWVLDPQDGTSAFLRGFRGSSVSIGLLVDHIPVLGVVHAPLYPNDQGDTISGAQGIGLFRNGEPVHPKRQGHPLCARDIVAVSQDADRRIEYNLSTLKPARYLPMPSIAYRLALAAAGEVRAGMSLAPVRALDVAAGHALLLLSGRDMQQLGSPEDPHISYKTQSRMHGVIGGDAQAIRDLTPWNWQRFGPKQRPPLVRPSHRLRASGLSLDRAQGCLLGQVAGDSLCSLVAFQSETRIAESRVNLRELKDGGTWNTLAGQPTDDSEMALTLARQLLRDQRFVPDHVRGAYLAWLKSLPFFDIGNTVSVGIMGSPNPKSQANGSLMRCSPLGLAFTVEQLESIAPQESAITHIHPLCCDCCRIFTQTISRAIEGASPQEAIRLALEAAGPEVKALLVEAQAGPPTEFQHQVGWIKIAFVNAFHHLCRETPLCEAVVSTVEKGGETDTNAAIVGALLGAFQGFESIPRQWRTAILTCRPHPDNHAARKPRPVEYWAVDLMTLAEHLLCLRKKSVSGATF